MHLRHITYFTWLDEELVTVPNFPAWVCDFVGGANTTPCDLVAGDHPLPGDGKSRPASKRRVRPC